VLLTAALITRDEAHHLANCLSSIAPVVDEIVVVDTGSVDGTPDIAASFGARVLHEPWRDDFAHARNTGLDAANGEWILYIDADETFTDDGDVREALRDRLLVAGLVRFHVARAFTPYLEHRLFRNRPDIRFAGAMHETITPAVQRAIEADGGRVAPVPATIDHHGYEGDQTAKHRRNLPLLEQAVRDDPERAFLWFHLGVVRAGLGDTDGADAAWSEAVRRSRARGEMNDIDVLAYVELALHRVRAGRSADHLVAELERQRPADPLTRWAAAHQAMFEARWADAIALLAPLRAIDPDTLLHTNLAYNRAIFGSLAAHATGTCWFHLGDDAAAAACFAEAREADPGNEELLVKLQLATARAARA